jgi:DNA-binding response OmpR family regulator
MTIQSCESACPVILVAEDEAPIRSVLLRVLSSYGFTVLTAENGRHALNVAREYSGKIDLLLANVQMLEMTGIELATEIGTSRPETRVLLISGLPPMIALDKGWALFPKPFMPRALVEKIHAMLAEPQPPC